MDIRVTPNGLLVWRDQTRRCALGHAGVGSSKREGDGVTPSGCFALQRVLYRSDRLAIPQTAMPVGAIDESDAWCDDPHDPNYNQPVKLPYANSHERLWRDDSLYDLIVVLDFNDQPPIRGAGSAIFLHVAQPIFAPTKGCIALACDALYELLAECAPGDRLCVMPPLAPGSED